MHSDKRFSSVDKIPKPNFSNTHSSLSKGIPQRWSGSSTVDGFVEGYFTTLIRFINYWRVCQRVFHNVHQIHQLLNGLSKGIRQRWSGSSTIDGFIKGYFSRFIKRHFRWMINSIGYEQIDYDQFTRIFQRFWLLFKIDSMMHKPFHDCSYYHVIRLLISYKKTTSSSSCFPNTRTFLT